MTRDRLTSQIQNDQLELFRLQNQLSTGQRYFLPSEDPASAQRAMALQRTIERKEQSLSNLNGAVASLTTTLDSIRSTNTDLNEIKATLLGVVDTISNDDDRIAAITSIDQLLEDLTRVGNSTFVSNYLLGGAERSSEAYQGVSQYVEYLGDESTPQTFVDIGQLFDTGIAGTEVFGGISESVRGYADLNPALTPDTRLDQINGGLGLSPDGAVEITFVPTDTSEPTTQAIVDLTNAKTIDDVARLIEANGPAGGEISVQIENNALRVDVGNGTITIGEVGTGDTARELGIESSGAPVATVNGTDLDPSLRSTTQLQDLAGAKARGIVTSLGTNNDVVLTANTNSADLNGVTIVYDDDGSVSAGSEVATYDGGTNTLTVSIESGSTTAAQVAAAISAEGTFTAETDYRDQSSFAERGTGTVVAGTPTASIAGGITGSIDLTSGIQLTNGADYVIDTSEVETVEQLLSLLNRPEYGLSASINAAGDGIDVRTRRSGADFAIGENGGTTATQLGIRTYNGDSRLEDFNLGVGVIIPGEGETQADIDADTRRQNTFEITVQDQGTTTTYDIDPVGIDTVQDLIDRINDTVVNGGAGGAVVASLATEGNGIVLTRPDVVDAAAPATAVVDLADGGQITFAADTAGAAGNDTDFTLDIADSGGTGPATATFDPATLTVTVDLNGSTTETTATIAALISTELPDHTVSESIAGTVTTVESLNADLDGGYDADEFTVSGNVGERLGFFASDETSATSTAATLASDDTNPLEVDSVFTALIRMREALEASDSEALSHELEGFDDHIDRVSFARAEIGVRLQNLESVEQRLSDEEVTLRTALSDEIDADLVEVISDYTAKQYALQASLQTAGSLLNLSILDFI